MSLLSPKQKQLVQVLIDHGTNLVTEPLRFPRYWWPEGIRTRCWYHPKGCQKRWEHRCMFVRPKDPRVAFTTTVVYNLYKKGYLKIIRERNGGKYITDCDLALTDPQIKEGDNPNGVKFDW